MQDRQCVSTVASRSLDSQESLSHKTVEMFIDGLTRDIEMGGSQVSNTLTIRVNPLKNKVPNCSASLPCSWHRLFCLRLSTLVFYIVNLVNFVVNLANLVLGSVSVHFPLTMPADLE